MMSRGRRSRRTSSITRCPRDKPTSSFFGSLAGTLPLPIGDDAKELA